MISRFQQLLFTHILLQEAERESRGRDHGTYRIRRDLEGVYWIGLMSAGRFLKLNAVPPGDNLREGCRYVIDRMRRESLGDRRVCANLAAVDLLPIF